MATLSLADRSRIVWVISYLQNGGGGKFIDSKVAEQLGKVFNNTCGFSGCCVNTFQQGLKSAPVLTLLQAMLCGDEGLIIPDAEGTVVVDGEPVPVPGPSGPVAPDMLTTCGYGVLAATTITNTGPTFITGDLGLFPGTSVTGAPTVSGTSNVTNAAAQQAQVDLIAVYNDLANRTGATTVAGNIGGQTLEPGVYKSTSTLAISSGDLTLDGGGNVNSVFIFQIGSSLTTTSGRNVILIGGAQAKNVFWQVGSSATIGSGSSFKGNIVALTAATIVIGATVEGRVLVREAAVTLDTNTVVSPGCE